MELDSFLGELFLKEELSDMRVIVENKMEMSNIPAHSLVLKRRSPVIAKMLESDFVEGQTQTIVITDFRVKHMEMFLRFLYTDILPETYTGLCELVKIADKYLVPKLTERCEESLIPLVNIQNVYELCELADMYTLEKLLDRCLFLIKRAAFKLLKCDDSKCLSKEIMEKIISANDLNVSNEVDVFWAIWRWANLKFRYQGVTCSNENVGKFIGDLLKHVRWNLIKDEMEKIVSLGITVDKGDLEKESPPRESSMMDMLWFLNQSDVLQMGKYTASCTLLKEHFKPVINEVELMHAVSLSDMPFYVVGVLLSVCVKKEPIRVTLVCSCESLSAVAKLKPVLVESTLVFTDNAIKFDGTKMTTDETCFGITEIGFEFPKPVEVRKHQQFVIKFKEIRSNFGGIRLKFERKVIRSCMGRDLFVDGDLLGIKKIFLL